MFYAETRTVESTKDAVIDLTADVKEVLAKSNINNGFLVVEIPHSTAGIMGTTSHVTDTHADIVAEVRRLVPSRLTFKHEETPDDAAGHVKCALFGNSITSIVREGKLVSGETLGYFLMEYDGPRPRRYHVAVLGE